jgi:beta-glucanase (GH16 family)
MMRVVLLARPRPGARTQRPLIGAVAAALALALASSAAGTVSTRLAVSYHVVGSRVRAEASAGPAAALATCGRATCHALLQQRVSSAKSHRLSWSTRASIGKIGSGRASHFTLAWTAPKTATTALLRVVVMSGRSTRAVSAAKRVRLAPKPASASTSSTCGGEVPPAKPGGGAWVCTFDDEFDASTGDADALNRSWWMPQVTNGSGFTAGAFLENVCYLDSPQTIAVADGALHLTVRKEPTPTRCGELTSDYEGGMVTTDQKFSQTYGRFEVRAQLPPANARGLQETLWLYPVNSTMFGNWPGSGEVDFSEFYGDQPSLDVPTIHYKFASSTIDASTATNTATSTTCHIDVGQYNDYAVVWSPGNFTITINGQLCLVDNYVPDGGLTSPAPFNQPFFIALTQALGTGVNAVDPLAPPALPATTSIDYVRVWR